MDDADYAAIEIEREETRRITNRQPARLAGPRECNRCGEINDRRHDGFAICRACAEEMTGEAS